MKTRKQIIEEYASKGYTVGTFNDIKDSIDYVSENTLIFLNNDKSRFFLEDVCPRYEGDSEDIDFVEYVNYRKTKKWKTLASHIKEIHKNKCAICGSERRLVIHHKTYVNLYNEKNEDLICICNTCHYKIHNGCNCFKADGKLCDACSHSKEENPVLFNFLFNRI